MLAEGIRPRDLNLFSLSAVLTALLLAALVVRAIVALALPPVARFRIIACHDLTAGSILRARDVCAAKLTGSGDNIRSPDMWEGLVLVHSLPQGRLVLDQDLLRQQVTVNKDIPAGAQLTGQDVSLCLDPVRS